MKEVAPGPSPTDIPGLAPTAPAAPGPAAGLGPADVPGLAPAAVASPQLRPDASEGSKRIGPGLAAGAANAAGSSRAMAAPVQPPGYGLDTGPAVEPPPPPPVEDPRLGRRVALVGAALVVAVLLVGGAVLWLTRPAYLDTAAVGRDVGASLTDRLGGPVSVTCPGDQERRAGVTFSCTASDGTGTRREVTVSVVDNSGKYTWALRTA